MTQYDFFEQVSQLDSISDEMKAYVAEQLDKLNKKKAEAEKKRAEKAKVDNPLKKAISDFLSKGSNFAAVVGVEIGVNTSKASYLMRDMESEGYLSSVMDKAPGAKSKSKKYTLVKPFVDEDSEGSED